MQTPAGFISDDSRHYLDHLSPFCALQGWPLFVCEGELAELARRYYPDLEVIEQNRWDLNLPPIVVSCEPRNLIELDLPADPSRKHLWLPHGNSDKGWKVSIFKPLQNETALVYGQRMVDFMHETGAFPDLVRIGNFRLAYWIKHRCFYNKLVEKEIPLPKAKKTYIYAPTWEDAEGNGSFWEMFPLLTKHLPSDCNLIVKLHPNTEKKFAPEIERLIGAHAKQSNIVFISEFLPIYPLLNICDAYIGDMSSIGYDFLYWNRPMYFFKTSERSQYLYRCGMEIYPEKACSIFEKPPLDLKDIQSQVYAYTFDLYSPLKEGSTNTTFKSLREQAVGRASIS